MNDRFPGPLTQSPTAEGVCVCVRVPLCTPVPNNVPPVVKHW